MRFGLGGSDWNQEFPENCATIQKGDLIKFSSVSLEIRRRFFRSPTAFVATKKKIEITKPYMRKMREDVNHSVNLSPQEQSRDIDDTRVIAHYQFIHT